MNEIVFPAGILQPPFFDAAGRRRRELRRHRHGHRPRDDARLRRPGQPVRRRRQPARTGGPTADTQGLRGAAGRRRRSSTTPTAAARPGHQRQADPGREHRRPRRPARSPSQRSRSSLENEARRRRRSTASRPSSASSWATPRPGGDSSRPEPLRVRLNTDPHCPAEYRVLGPLSNLPEFHAAFGCSAGAAMVRPKEKRPAIW